MDQSAHISAPLSIKDSNDRVFLYEHELVINWKGKSYNYPLSGVKKLNYQFNRRLASMILGGIIAPLSVVAYFKFMVPGREAILYLLLGIGLIYHGWAGRYMFSIESTEGKKLILTTFEDNTKLHELIRAFYTLPRIQL